MVEQAKVPFPPPPPPPIFSSKATAYGDKVKDSVVCNLKTILASKDGESEREVTRRLVRPLIDSEQTQGEMRTPLLISHRQRVAPLVQEGPQCGLVALCMASHLLQGKTVTIDDAVETARDNGYTLQGEMFSANNMAQLSKQLCYCDAELVRDQERCQRVTSALLQGKPVLVPYDKDHNNEPCCRKGEKAHWAALTGILLVSKADLTSKEQERLIQDTELPSLYHMHQGQKAPKDSANDCSSSDCFQRNTFEELFNADRLLQDQDSTQVFVYAVQGKSIRTHLWSLESLLQSNSNLCQLDPKIENNKDQFIVPEQGVQYGLQNQVVILSNENS